MPALGSVPGFIPKRPLEHQTQVRKEHGQVTTDVSQRTGHNGRVTPDGLNGQALREMTKTLKIFYLDR